MTTSLTEILSPDELEPLKLIRADRATRPAKRSISMLRERIFKHKKTANIDEPSKNRCIKVRCAKGETLCLDPEDAREVNKW
jgi:hypothetical protein